MHDTDTAEQAFRAARLGFQPWERTAADLNDPAHRARCDQLAAFAGAQIDPTAYVAPNAAIFTETLTLGPDCIIASHALLRGHLSFGAACSVNPFACVSGRVTMGQGVRIASHATLVGFNHGIVDTGTPMYRQKTHSLGIEIGSDVWIGANAVILDGARIGDGVVIAAGAVVRGVVPDFAIMGGVPARVLGSRRAAPPQVAAGPDLAGFAQRVSDQWRDVLAAHHGPQGYLSADASGAARPAIRHLCDAVELAAGFGVQDDLFGPGDIARLSDLQDPETGLFPDPYRQPDLTRPLREDPIALYNVLAVGYALECLGAAPRHPVRAVELSAADLCAWLEALPWTTNAWSAGATVDAIATGLYFNARYFTTQRAREVLLGWLSLNVDRSTGLWGGQDAAGSFLLPVNGFYRLTRGCYHTFGVPVPHPERVIDTILSHYRTHEGFTGTAANACNLLDVVHPLWLCLRQTDHRRREAEAVARKVRAAIPDLWQDGQGIAFAPGHAPGLQGSEMWLSVLFTASALLGEEDACVYQPRGVHRLTAAGLG